jgi:hypothetical protein
MPLPYSTLIHLLLTKVCRSSGRIHKIKSDFFPANWDPFFLVIGLPFSYNQLAKELLNSMLIGNSIKSDQKIVDPIAAYKLN